MNKKMRIKNQIEETRQVLNNKLSQKNILNKDMIDMDVLNISWKLDELIVEFIKQETLHK